MFIVVGFGTTVGIERLLKLRWVVSGLISQLAAHTLSFEVQGEVGDALPRAPRQIWWSLELVAGEDKPVEVFRLTERPAVRYRSTKAHTAVSSPSCCGL